MPSVSGIVQNIQSQSRNTKYGPKPIYIVTIEGERYNSSFTKPKYSIGDEVSFNYTVGSYGNDIDQPTVRIVSGSGGAAEPAPARSTTPAKGPAPAQNFNKVFPVPPLHGDRAIIRQNALTNAREAVVGKYQYIDDSFPSNDALAKEIIELASMFEAWTAGDVDAVRAKELAGEDKKPKAKKAETKVEELYED